MSVSVKQSLISLEGRSYNVFSFVFSLVLLGSGIYVIVKSEAGQVSRNTQASVIGLSLIAALFSGLGLLTASWADIFRSTIIDWVVAILWTLIAIGLYIVFSANQNKVLENESGDMKAVYSTSYTISIIGIIVAAIGLFVARSKSV